LLNQLSASKAGPGHWNDPDMLQIGNGVLTPTEERSHFALWAFAKAPLIIGCDLTTITSDQLKILKNKALIALNQDPLGEQAVCAMNCDYTPPSNGNFQVYKVQLTKKDNYGVLIINWDDQSPVDVKLNFHDIGISKFDTREVFCSMTDLWSG